MINCGFFVNNRLGDLFEPSSIYADVNLLGTREGYLQLADFLIIALGARVVKTLFPSSLRPKSSIFSILPCKWFEQTDKLVIIFTRDVIYDGCIRKEVIMGGSKPGILEFIRDLEAIAVNPNIAPQKFDHFHVGTRFSKFFKSGYILAELTVWVPVKNYKKMDFGKFAFLAFPNQRFVKVSAHPRQWEVEGFNPEHEFSTKNYRRMLCCLHSGNQ